MPITFVNWQLIDSGHGFDAILAKAASSYCQLTVEGMLNACYFFL